MAQSQVLMIAPVEQYRPLNWYGQAVYNSHQRLCDYLKLHNGDYYASLLASVRIQQREYVWFSEKASKNTLSFNQIPQNEQENIISLIENILYEINIFATNLINSGEEDDKKWGLLLKLAFQIPDLDHVFIDGEHLFFTGWGFEPIGGYKSGPLGKNLNLNERKQPAITPVLSKINSGLIENKKTQLDPPGKHPVDSSGSDNNSEIKEDVPEFNKKDENSDIPVKPDLQNKEIVYTVSPDSQPSILPDNKPIAQQNLPNANSLADTPIPQIKPDIQQNINIPGQDISSNVPESPDAANQQNQSGIQNNKSQSKKEPFPTNDTPVNTPAPQVNSEIKEKPVIPEQDLLPNIPDIPSTTNRPKKHDTQNNKNEGEHIQLPKTDEPSGTQNPQNQPDIQHNQNVPDRPKTSDTKELADTKNPPDQLRNQDNQNTPDRQGIDTKLNPIDDNPTPDITTKPDFSIADSTNKDDSTRFHPYSPVGQDNEGKSLGNLSENQTRPNFVQPDNETEGAQKTSQNRSTTPALQEKNQREGTMPGNESKSNPTDQKISPEDTGISNSPPNPPIGKPIIVWQPGCFYSLAALFLLALILFPLFYRSCRVQETYNIPQLPKDHGVIVPVDPGKIVSAPDSVRNVVANRLNVALTGKNKDIPAFARAFKQAYPDNAFQIIYYDTLTYRLQVQIPDSLRSFLITDLPKKLSEFDMIIWDESIFQNNAFPNDPGFSSNVDSWYFKAVKVENAWQSTYGNKDMVIAIIDDGLDITHPEFSGKIYKPWNVCEKSSDVKTYPKAFHGTHVAGLVAATRDNNEGVAGIASNCKIMPIQVTDRNGIITSTAIIDGILFAINQGAQVINISLGLQMQETVGKLPVAVQQDIINHAHKAEESFWNQIFNLADKQNITIIIAAGNQNVLVGLDPMQRNPLGIKVSAVDTRLNKATFSNYGALSTISAPGVAIYSSMPNGRYALLDGTSMAAPIVTGGIALLKSLNPKLSNKQLIDLIQQTGLPLSSSNKPIGKLIQLDKAIAKAGGLSLQGPGMNCPEIRTKIESLQKEIDRLKALCPK